AQRSQSLEIRWVAAARFYPCIESGDVVGATRTALDLAELAETTKLPDLLGVAQSRRASVLTLAGRLDEAEAVARKCHEVQKAAGTPEADIVLLGSLLPILGVQGRGAELL